MKKLLWILIAVLTFNTVPTFTFAESNLADTLDFLNAVGVKTNYEIETITENQAITRAVFSENVAKLLNMHSQKSNKVYYHDVSRDHWAFDFIGVMTQAGYMSGDGQNYFHPDDIMTKEQAAKVLVSALGYDYEAGLNGGYPTGYMNIAYSVNLLKGCSSEKNLVLKDMLKMFENALNAEVSNLISLEDEEQTLMAKYYDIYYEKGVLNGCDGVNLVSEQALLEDIAVIDGLQYSTKLKDLIYYIGAEIEFLYKADDKDSTERELVWLNPRKSNEILDIKKDLNCEFDKSDFVMHCYDDETKKTEEIKIDNGVMVIYNGVLAEENISGILSMDRYHARFIRTQDSNRYNIAVIDAYENIVVGNIDKDLELIHDIIVEGNSLSYNKNDWDRIEFIDINIDEIKVGDVLSVYKSTDGSIVKIACSSRNQQVKATQIIKDVEKILKTPDGDFEFYDKNADFIISTGETVKLYFDIDGYIAYLEPVSRNNAVAYLMKAYYDDSSEELSLKLLNSDGSIARYNTTEKIKIDGISYKNKAEAFNIFQKDGTTKEQIIVLSINSDGKINKIDTQDVTAGVEREESSLRVYYKVNNELYRGMGRLGKKIAIDNNTTLFSVPEQSTGNDEDYTVKTKAGLQSDLAYNAIVYRYTDENLDYEDVVLTYKNAWKPNSVNILVESINGCVNANGDVVEELKGNQGGNDISYLTDGNFSMLKEAFASGDIISAEINTKGEICSAELVYKYGSGTMNATNSNFNANNRMLVGYAHDKSGNTLKVGYKNPSDFDELFITTDSQIVIYNAKQKDKIRQGNMWNIKTYKTAQNEASLVAVQTFTATTKSVIIYE